MWDSQLLQSDRQTVKIVLSENSRVLSFHEVIHLWRNSQQFRTFFKELVSQSPFEAFFWETPPVTKKTISRSFEFVMVESGLLSGLAPDPSSFKSQFSARPSEQVLTFPNLGGDALLVVPAAVADLSCYTHLARFVRSAPSSQIDAFWAAVGNAMQNRVSDVPVWLSTAGLGVSWLHLRLDSRPKYYRHEPYKQA